MISPWLLVESPLVSSHAHVTHGPMIPLPSACAAFNLRSSTSYRIQWNLWRCTSFPAVLFWWASNVASRRKQKKRRPLRKTSFTSMVFPLPRLITRDFGSKGWKVGNSSDAGPLCSNSFDVSKTMSFSPPMTGNGGLYLLHSYHLSKWWWLMVHHIWLVVWNMFFKHILYWEE